MNWWGKLVGGTMGFALAGPLGALLGGAAGHLFDRRSFARGGEALDSAQLQAAFFTATFSVMGHVAKADGRVSEEEIELARQIMQNMNLNGDQRQAAINLFQQGKEPGFDLVAVVSQFSSACGRKINIKRMFLEVQVQAAYADGDKQPSEDRLLKEICNLLGLPAFVLYQLEAVVKFHFQQQGGNADYRTPGSGPGRLQEAYHLLNVSENVSAVELKRAYRRLMSQHHPDKLVAKGMPEEMISIATEKSKDIQRAYEMIKSAKGYAK